MSIAAATMPASAQLFIRITSSDSGSASQQKRKTVFAQPKFLAREPGRRARIDSPHGDWEEEGQFERWDYPLLTQATAVCSPGSMICFSGIRL